MHSTEHPDSLSELLREWRVDTPLPPGFQQQVWRGIAQAEGRGFTAPWLRFRQWLEAGLAKPAWALAYALVLLLAGVGAGTWHAQAHAARTEIAWQSRYLQVVDPFRTERLATP